LIGTTVPINYRSSAPRRACTPSCVRRTAFCVGKKRVARLMRQLGIEGVSRRAIAQSVYVRVSAVGIALFLLLFYVGLSNDLGG